MFKIMYNDLLGGICNDKKTSRYDYEKVAVDFNSIKVGTDGSYKESR